MKSIIITLLLLISSLQANFFDQNKTDIYFLNDSSYTPKKAKGMLEVLKLLFKKQNLPTNIKLFYNFDDIKSDLMMQKFDDESFQNSYKVLLVFDEVENSLINSLHDNSSLKTLSIQLPLLENEFLDNFLPKIKQLLKSQRFIRDDLSQIVTDSLKNLMWQDDDESKRVKKRWISLKSWYEKDYFNTTGDSATSYCKNLTLGKYSDWRLPTMSELKTIANLKESSFKNIATKNYWSSTTYRQYPGYTWVINLSTNKYSIDRNKSYLNIKCVRTLKR